MVLHIVKLCVGVSELKEFEDWRRSEQKAGRDMSHTTRMFPKRAPEIIKGGSIFWVIRGFIMVRQPIKALEPVRGRDGIKRCRIVFESDYVLVRPTPGGLSRGGAISKRRMCRPISGRHRVWKRCRKNYEPNSRPSDCYDG